MNKVKKFLYSQKAAPYVFILPFVLTVILFWVFPIANGVLLSFQDVLKDKWVGMNNYKRLLSDTYFRKAVWNSFKYMVGTLVLLIPFPMLFASMLNSKLMKAKGFFKSVYFIPALTSVVVVGTIFRLMFGEMDTALANQILNFFGHSSIKWLKGEWRIRTGRCSSSVCCACGSSVRRWCCSSRRSRACRRISTRRLPSTERQSGSSLRAFQYRS